MTPQEFEFCETCSRTLLSEWKGWPNKNVIPHLPTITAGKCDECGESSILSSAKIEWFNYHSGGGGGLPTYWLLVIDKHHSNWGTPYYAEGCCPSCGDTTVVSEYIFPDGKRELKHNCNKCGVRLVKKNYR
jgi:hypothetical protein